MNASPSSNMDGLKPDDNIRSRLEDAEHRLRLADSEIAQLKGELDIKSARIVALEQNVSKLQEESCGYFDDLQSCRADRDQLRKQFQDSSSVSEASLTASFSAQVRSLERERDESQHSLAVLMDANTLLAKELDRMKAIVETTRRDYDSVFKGLFAEKTAAELQRDQAHQQLAAANSRCEGLVHSLTQANRVIEANNLQSLATQMDTRRAAMTALLSKNTRALQELRTVKPDSSELESLRAVLS
jgi:chromosome segregation ATPase